jgi:predicted MPP superfamily phosphohydrolase
MSHANITFHADEIRIAVISDIHAYSKIDKDKPKPSHYHTTENRRLERHHPLPGLFDLINNASLTADILLLPGDLGDKADPDGITIAWQDMCKVAERLKSTTMLSTVGNHDVNSRGAAVDACATLRQLDPKFPCDDPNYTSYWGAHFSVTELEHIRVVLLNSCAHHDGHLEMEKYHGRVLPETVAALERSLRGAKRKPLNILLTHHHVIHDAKDGENDTEVMRNADELMSLLNSGEFGEWMIIHGHRHEPRLSYASGGGLSPTVLSAGSFSATLYPDLASRSRNQFHLITFSLSALAHYGLVGQIQTWSWHKGCGWRPAGTMDGLPHHSGFGMRGPMRSAAAEIAGLVRNACTDWKMVVERLPLLRFLVPVDLLGLFVMLRSDFGIGAEFSDLGLPTQLRAL